VAMTTAAATEGSRDWELGFPGTNNRLNSLRSAAEGSRDVWLQGLKAPIGSNNRISRRSAADGSRDLDIWENRGSNNRISERSDDETLPLSRKQRLSLASGLLASRSLVGSLHCYLPLRWVQGPVENRRRF